MTSEPTTQEAGVEAPAERLERERAATTEQHHVSVEEGSAQAVGVVMTQAEIEQARAEQEAPPEVTGGSINPPAPPAQTPFQTAAEIEHPGQVTGGWNNPGPYMVTVEQQEQQAAAAKAAREAAGEPEPEPQPEPELAPPPDPLSTQPGADYIGAQQQAGELGPMTTTSPSMEDLEAQHAEQAAAASAEATQQEEQPAAAPAPKEPAPATPPAGGEEPPSSSF